MPWGMRDDRYSTRFRFRRRCPNVTFRPPPGMAGRRRSRGRVHRNGGVPGPHSKPGERPPLMEREDHTREDRAESIVNPREGRFHARYGGALPRARVLPAGPAVSTRGAEVPRESRNGPARGGAPLPAGASCGERPAGVSPARRSPPPRSGNPGWPGFR
jgi:hypothetical protein